MKNFRAYVLMAVFYLIFVLPVAAQQKAINVTPQQFVTSPDVEISIPNDPTAEYDRVEIRSGSDVTVGKYIKSKKFFSFHLKLTEIRVYKFVVDGFKDDDRVGIGSFKIERVKDDSVSADAPTEDTLPKNTSTPGAKSSPGKKEGLLSVSIDRKEDEPATTGSIHSISILPKNIPANATKYLITRTAGDVIDQKSEIINKTASKPNSPQDIPVELKSGPNSVKVVALDDSGKVIENSEATVSIICVDCDYVSRNINSRAIVGFEQVGASSANSSTTPFVDLFLNVPLGNYKAGSNKRVFSFWTDFRFSASSQQNFAALSNVSTGLLNSLSGSSNSFNDIVQSFNVTGGLDYEFVRPGSLHPFFIPGKSAVSFIIGGGVTNPLSSDKTVQVYKIPMINNKVNPDFAALFNGVDFTNKTTVSFVKSERDRFFRRYFAGFRLKNYFYENEDRAIDQSPAMLDVTVGQNEAITNRLQGLVLNVEGFLPFPTRKYDYIYLFGGFNMKFHKNINKNIPFFLETPSVINLSDSSNVVVPIDSTPFTRSNRDTFRFGIGIDLLRLINKSDSKPTASSH